MSKEKCANAMPVIMKDTKERCYMCTHYNVKCVFVDGNTVCPGFYSFKKHLEDLRRKYDRENDKYNCTTCKYSDTDQIGDRYCVNDKSEHCADFVNKNNVCELWEELENENLH